MTLIATSRVIHTHNGWMGTAMTVLLYAAIVAIIVFGYRWLRKAWRYYKFGRDHQL